MATDKQIAFIKTLAKGRQMGPVTAGMVDVVDSLSTAEASKLIDTLKGLPKTPPLLPAYGEALKVGMYRTNTGEILRVYVGQNSGMNLVKRVVGIPENGYEYEYLGSANRLAQGRSTLGIVEVSPLPLEEAKFWGKMTKSCIACGKRLDDPESADAGIGPVCAKKF